MRTFAMSKVRSPFGTGSPMVDGDVGDTACQTPVGVWLLGLVWADVKLEARMLRVRQSVQRFGGSLQITG